MALVPTAARRATVLAVVALALIGCTTTATQDRVADPNQASGTDPSVEAVAVTEASTHPGPPIAGALQALGNATSTTTATTPTTIATTIATPVLTVPPGPPPNVDPLAALSAPLPAIGTASGAETARVQERLVEAGFWLSSADGAYELTTRQAVMAFQKYVGLPTTSEVDQATAAALSELDLRARGRADAGTLVEIDKIRQLLFVVVDGRTQWVFNTSTGNGEPYVEPDKNTPGEVITGVALTPDGLHHVNRERPEGWWAGDLGEIYRPKYFVGGIAVHGSGNVPDYPASHGCVRVTVQAMDFIWEAGLIPMEMPVWVHQQRPA